MSSKSPNRRIRTLCAFATRSSWERIRNAPHPCVEQNGEPTKRDSHLRPLLSSRPANLLKGIENLGHAHRVPATVRVEVAAHTPSFIIRNNMPERHPQKLQADSAVLDRQMVVTFRGAP